MSIVLTNTRPGEWDGTFAVLVKTLVDDLLSDGQSPQKPEDGHFRAAVLWTSDADYAATGMVTGWDDGFLVILPPTRPPAYARLEEITSITVDPS